MMTGHSIAHVASCWLFTMEALVQSRPVHVTFVVDRVALEHVFFSTSPVNYSSVNCTYTSVTWGWYSKSISSCSTKVPTLALSPWIKRTGTDWIENYKDMTKCFSFRLCFENIVLSPCWILEIFWFDVSLQPYVIKFDYQHCSLVRCDTV
jgi:hypothetical protein